MKVLYISFILKGVFSKVISGPLPFRLMFVLQKVLFFTDFPHLNIHLQGVLLKNSFHCVVSALNIYIYVWKYWRNKVMDYHQHFKKACIIPEGFNENSIDKREGRNFILYHLLSHLILLLLQGETEIKKEYGAL